MGERMAPVSRWMVHTKATRGQIDAMMPEVHLLTPVLRASYASIACRAICWSHADTRSLVANVQCNW